MGCIDHACIAPIIRGLCINTTGYPWVVIRSPSEAEIPLESLTVDIASAIKENTFDEEAAAKVFREAYTAWEFEIAPAGVEAAVKTKRIRKEPSCVVVKNHDVVEALYWIDRDIDAAKKRMQDQNASFLEEKVPARFLANNGECSRIDAGHRANVVKNKIILVAGGVQGIGPTLVKSLAASGALVFIADANREEVEKLANSINAGERRTAAIPVQVQLTEEDSVEALCKTVVATTGGFDIGIVNAEASKVSTVLEQSLDDVRFVTDANYIGFFLMAKHAGLLLRCQHRTAPFWKTDLIQINAKQGLKGEERNGAIAGGKFGSIGLIQSIALELVAYNIKVNAVCPGNFFDHALWADPEKGLFAQYFKTGHVPGAKCIADVKNYYEATIPMKRGCTDIDVMRAIFYIIEQEYETGQAVPVTGGEIMLH